MRTINFKDKVIWVTGASSGIGAELALQLNEKGAVVIASARRLDKLTALKNSCCNPENLHTVPLDITDETSIANAVKEVKDLARLDLLIHNAGIAQKGLVIENPMEIDRMIMETNYFGTVALTKAVMPIFMRQGHGWFAVMSSFGGVMGLPCRSAYAASKHALHGFFKSLEIEEMDCKMKVSYIIPGFINTEITAKGLQSNGAARGSVETSHKLGMSAQRCAADTIKGLEKRRNRIPIGKFEIHLLTIHSISPRLARWIIKNHPMRRIRKLQNRFRPLSLNKRVQVVE